MKKRWHFFIVMGVLLIGLIVGSIAQIDLKINETIFDPKNGFGLVISSFGMIPGYGTLSFLGGVLTYITLKGKNEFKTWLKVLFVALSVAMYGISVYFLGKDVFSVNGFYNEKLHPWLGCIIMGVLMVPVFYLGFWMGKKNTNPKLWIAILIAAAVIFIALVPGVTLFKAILHRPRYRSAVYNGNVLFHNWWQRCGEYKEIIANSNGTLTKEEFKSFPSGHSAATMCGLIWLTFLPLIDNRLMKYQTILFYVAFAWGLVVMFARMLVGAHFLTDVCFGALLTVVCYYIGNEFILKYCLPKEETNVPLEEAK